MRRRARQRRGAAGLLLLLVVLLPALVAAACRSPQQQQPPLARSVLYVVVDDLTAELGLFGGPVHQASMPNLERLARRPGATSFRRAYSQLAVCGPSRNSFLSGRYPDTLRVYSFVRSFRDDFPDAVPLPQAFKQSGYLTCGFGKIYHDDGVLSPPDYDQPYSWSEECPYYAPAEDWCDSPQHGWCTPDMPQANFTDARGVDAAIGRLRQFVGERGAGEGEEAAAPRPFFFAVGIRKPHLDWAIPKPFLDRQVPQDDIALPPLAQRITPLGMPPVAWWNCSVESPWQWGLPGVPLHPTEPLPEDLMKELRRAYLGAVSWMDHEVGRLLDALDALGLADETAVVFHSDHGWHLGDGGEWCKETTMEAGTRVPLIVALPPGPSAAAAAAAGGEAPAGAVSHEIVELVDVYPTLLDLAGLPPADPDPLPGRSLVPFLSSNDTHTAPAGGKANDETVIEAALLARGAAFSQFPRCSSPAVAPSPLAAEGFLWNRQCMMMPNSRLDAMGYAVRVDGWRYVEWYAWDRATWLPRWNDTGRGAEGGSLGMELYEMDVHGGGESEGRLRNVVEREPGVAKLLSRVLREHFWPLFRPRRPGDLDISPAVAATRWQHPPPPGRGDVGVLEGEEKDEVREAWGELWRGGEDSVAVE